MVWEYAKGPLIFSRNDQWLQENGFTSSSYEAIFQRFHELVDRGRRTGGDIVVTDRELDHYFRTGEVYDNAEGTRKSFLGLS